MSRDRNKGSKKGDWIDQGPSGINSPFAALGRLMPQDAADPQQSEPDKAETEARPSTEGDQDPGERGAAGASVARAVIRLERKGRGGKTATVVTHLGLPGEVLEVWCKVLRKGLGCGGQVEGDQLVFHGDQRQRLTPLLEARGVRRVTLG